MRNKDGYLSKSFMNFIKQSYQNKLWSFQMLFLKLLLQVIK